MTSETRIADLTAKHAQLRVDQQHQRREIISQWESAINDSLAAIGKTIWGDGKYTVIHQDNTTVWALVNMIGTKSSQYYVVLHINEVDLNTTLDSVPHSQAQLAIATGFSVIGSETMSCVLTQDDIERTLVIAAQKGPDVGPLPDDLKKELQKYPYQIDEADSGFGGFIVKITGPLYLLIGVALIVLSFPDVISDIPLFLRVLITDPIGILSILRFIDGAVLFVIGIVFVAAGYGYMRLTNNGRHGDPYRPVLGKRTGPVPILPRIVMQLLVLPVILISILTIVTAIVGFIYAAAGGTREYQLRKDTQIVIDELKRST